MKKVLVGLLIVFFVISPVHFAIARDKESKLPNSLLFSSSQMVDIVIEGWEEPWVSSMEKKEKLVIQSQYSNTLSHWQQAFIQQFSELPVFHVMDTFQLCYNGIWVKTRGYNVPLMAKSGLVRKIHLVEERVYPLRTRVRETIQMPSYPEAVQDHNYPDGLGTKIGIVDTGIFYPHEDFWPEGTTKEPTFPNDKVIGGYDFADKDADPNDDKNGHGTHVAGISAGHHAENEDNQGIAPKAVLLAYKVFSSKNPGAGASGASIISAAEAALEDACTVINLSLGHDGEAHSFYEDSPYYTALDNAVKGGVVVVAAAGNDGSRIEGNPWPIHAPGVFLNLIQVAASDDRGLQTIELKYPSSWSRTLLANLARYTPPFSEELSNYPIVEAGYGREEDFKDIDVEGKVVLISRGPVDKGITFQEKNLNAKKYGAKGCIIYNYAPEGYRGTMISATDDPKDFDFLPTFMVSGIAAKQIRFCVQNQGSVHYKKPLPPIISDYTSAGPCLDGDLGVFKPEICAPGTLVRASIPAYKDETRTTLVSAWTDLSGTSMASPVVTGVVALLKQKHPEWTPYDIKCVLMNSADLLINPLNQEVFSFYYQGSGQVNAEQALQTQAIISPPSIMRCSGTLKEKSQLKIQNITEESISVEVRSLFFTTDDQAIQLLTDKPFMVIPPHQTETMEYWFHTEEDQQDWSKMEGVIWFQVRSLEEENKTTQSLHVPMILYSGSTDKMMAPVSQHSISANTINREDHPIVTLQYTLNTGTVTRTITEMPGEKEGEIKKVLTIAARNYASVVQMMIYDQQNKLVYSQYLGEKIPVGSYQFAWDGKALEGMDVLQDGKYSLVVASQNWELNYKMEEGEQKLISQKSNWERSNSVSLEIKNSQASVKPVLLMATPNKVSSYSLQGVSFYLENAEEIDEVKVQVKYDKELLSPVLSEVQSFHLNAEAGEMTWVTKRPFAVQSRFFLGKHLFQWAKPGENPIKEIKVTCYFKGIALKREIIIDIPSVTIVDGKACVGDFNQDSVVNHADYEIWLPHYGTSWRSIGWNNTFDLNADWVIDTEDLQLLSRCME